MKVYLFIISLLICSNTLCHSQVGYAKTYQINLIDKSGNNFFPNHIVSFEIRSDSIFSFFYATDTLLKQPYGTGFGIFNTQGDLLDYSYIQSDDTFNYFYPEELITFDYNTFFTSINIKENVDGLLKYNIVNKKAEVFAFYNSVCDTCFMRFYSMSKGKFGEIILSHNVNVPTLEDPTFTKVQITKIDTCGQILWSKIFGENPKYFEVNNGFSTHVDDQGFYYFGLSWDNDGGSYKNYLYKLDTAGNILSKYNSKPTLNHAEIYDIVQSLDKSIYLSTNYNRNNGPTTIHNEFGTLVVKLNSDLSFNNSFKIGRADLGEIPVDQILISNEEDGIVGILTNAYYIYYPRFDSNGVFIDTVTSWTRKASLTKISNNGDSLWMRSYTVRENSISHWKDAERSELYDIKALPDKSGYIMGGLSFRYNAEEKLNEAPYVPLLIRVDNDGCIIPDCNKITKVSDPSVYVEFFRVYPNPFKGRLIIQHDVHRPAAYKISDIHGREMTRYISSDYGENSIILTYDWPVGTYVITATDLKGKVSSSTVIKQ